MVVGWDNKTDVQHWLYAATVGRKCGPIRRRWIVILLHGGSKGGNTASAKRLMVVAEKSANRVVQLQNGYDTAHKGGKGTDRMSKKVHQAAIIVPGGPPHKN